MGLRFDPMGGGQFNQMIKKIVEAESQPIKQLETRKGREEAKMKLFQEFKGKFANFDNTLQGFTNFQKFRELKVDLGDGDKQAGISIDKTKAQPGTYQVEVMQLAGRSSMASNSFASADEPVLGVGYITLKNANGEEEEIFVGGKDSSLNGVASLINSRKDSNVQAAVMKDATDPEKPWRLIVNSKKEGLENEVFFPEFYFLDGDEDFEIAHSQESMNGVLKINGIEVETDSNKIADFLPGVTLELKQAKEGQTFNINISEDNPKIAAKVKELATQINGILDFINKQNSVDDKTDTRASFAGDTSLQTIEYRLRNLFHEGFPIWDKGNDGDTPSRFINLTEIGLEFDKKGSIQFNEEKFTKAIERDYTGVAEAITGEFGFGMQMREVMANYTRPGNGLLATRERGLRQRIEKIDRDIETKQRLIDRRQEQLVNQFSRLQGVLSNMQQQQQYLSATMGGGGGNPIAQLMNGIG